MSSDTSAMGDIPALEPQTDPAAPEGREASPFAALAPDPARDLAAQEVEAAGSGQAGASGRGRPGEADPSA